MPAPRQRIHRSPWLAWLITAPLSAMTLAITVSLAFEFHAGSGWPLSLIVFFVLFLATEGTVLHLSARRQTYGVNLSEIPLLLALYFMAPALVVVTRLAALFVVQFSQRVSLVKICFNLATVGAATSAANLIVVAWGPLTSPEPRSWLVLASAVTAGTVTSLAAVFGVITLIQGNVSIANFIRTAASVFVVAAVNIVVGLVVLLAITSQPWSVLLLVGLGAILVAAYRSYAQFVQQHKSLTELYELTRAIGESARDGSLPDALLGRVRDILQAEFATLWLPAQGRYAEVLLTARVDDSGLLDMAETPAALRERAVAEKRTITVGLRSGDERLRAELRERGIKDAVVVPLRSGSAVIGSLEVAGRLGDLASFRPADVRLLETLAAHASVAVENSRLVDRLRFDAYHDTVTGLPNRRRLLASLEEAVKVRAPGEVVAVMLFDVDGLRDVNESLGHDAGDQLLVEVANRLRRLAPSSALVGRAGSDEFAVMLRQSSAEEAMEFAGQLRSAVRGRMEFGSVSLDVDTAVGIAVHPDHGTDPETLVQRANLAIHAAKQLAVPVQIFYPGLESRSAHRLGLAADMRQALEAGEIQVFFQPKVALPDRKVVGVECLARWEHPAHGMVSPLDFVPVAEHTGQLGRLTEVVLREALRQCRSWLDAGRPLTVAVNLSPRTLIDPTFPDRVASLLDEYHLPAEMLILEITEAGVVGEVDRPLPGLHRLHDMGVRLAVDDFGTGYSSLSYLRRLPAHEVKIDRSFVQGMATDEGDLAIVRAVVDLARHFGLSVVAEGVENELTVSLLEELGCDVGQGFLFSRPLPHERFEAWFAAQTESGRLVPKRTGEEAAAEGRRLRVVP